MTCGVQVLDWRDRSPRAQLPRTKKRAPRSKIRGGATVLRDPRTVEGVTIHQTAVIFGARAKHKAKALLAGDRSLAVAYRVAEDVPAHAVALDGRVVLRSPLRAYLYHANKLSGPTLGLEVEGVYSGLVDEAERTTWGDASRITTLSKSRIDSAAAGLEELVRLGRADGMPLRIVYAHRQSSASRRSDPGEAIWRALRPVWLDLGLVEAERFAIGGGRPLPAGWGPYSGRY